ncbi:hypothetical protein MMC17_006076 [Xylographa soralifera]|nr:hypothetical protein [Xylographa soralifera]
MIKVLIDAEELSTLLMLAKHPKIGIGGDVWSYGQSHQMGWQSIREAALRPYLALNIIVAMSTLHFNEERASWSYLKHYITRGLAGHDYDCQLLPHRKFWSTIANHNTGEKPHWEHDPFGQGSVLNVYLKKCFRILYCCDMVTQEAGLDPDWGGLLAEQMNHALPVRLD